MLFSPAKFKTTAIFFLVIALPFFGMGCNETPRTDSTAHVDAKPPGILKGEDKRKNDAADKSPSLPFVSKRRQMVAYQIKKRGIDERRILDAFLKVERHRFVPKKHIINAYEDRPLPIGEGQTISQPYVVAYMTYILDLKKSDKVLEVGTGSGYQAAILGELSNHVYTIEVIPSLGQKAEGLLQELGYTNVKVKIGDGYQGWQAHAPYDAIIATCAPSHVPKPLKDQLKEGGKMIIPVGEAYRQNLVLLKKTDNKLIEKNVFPVLFVPMVDNSGKKY